MTTAGSEWSGNQYHQPALLTASEHLIQRHEDRCETEATLVREPDNAHDPLAIQVMVRGDISGSPPDPLQ